MSEIKQLLMLRGFTEEEATKTYNRWYAWLNDTLSVKDVEQHFKAIEESKYNQLVIVKDIDVNLVCPHHLLPVVMKVHIGYVPNGKILGLSKFARVAKDLARPITQENYTEQVVEIINKKLEPQFVMAIVVGKHMCMCVRGVLATGSATITNALRSKVFSKSEVQSMKDELMRSVNLNG